MLQTLRKSEGSLVMPIPREFVDQNGLTDGSRVTVRLVARRLIVEVRTRPRYSVANLMSEMPGGLPGVEGWDELPSVGAEDDSSVERSAGDRLLRFAASQENVDRVAMRLAFCVAALGAVVAIATIAAMIAK
jgi:antitoxin ChpS